MTPDDRRDVLIVLHNATDPAAPIAEHRLRLPAAADLNDLLRALEQESPALHAEIRTRILRAAGRVLAYGTEGDLLPALKRQLVAGGPIVFPSEQPMASATDPVADGRSLS